MFVPFVDWQKLRIPGPEVVHFMVVAFDEAIITIEMHARGIPDDIPAEVLQEAVNNLWSDEE